MTHDEMIAVIAAHAEGKKIQCRMVGGGNWLNTDEPVFSFRDWEYRVAPEPRLRPWTVAEVPMPCVLRNKTSGQRYQVLQAANGRIVTTNGTTLTYTETQDLVANTEHSTDGGKTWKPCGVEE